MTDNDRSESPTAELVKSDYSEGDEFEFRADIRVRIHNPDGLNVVAVRTYKARPRADDLVSNEDHVHEFAAYWWPNSYPRDGDRPFTDASHDWKPSSDLNDDDALFEECVEIATYDAAAELDSLKSRSDRWRRKIEGESVER
jgi:curved DNA-binding protein CbpA